MSRQITGRAARLSRSSRERKRPRTRLARVDLFAANPRLFGPLDADEMYQKLQNLNEPAHGDNISSESD